MEIADYPNYLVYEDGRIFNKKSRKMLKVGISSSGYSHFSLYKDGKVKNFYVHRLVAIAYIPNPDNKPEVDHNDRDKSNNHVSNLRWATHIDNMQNRGMFKNNKLRIKNISYCKTNKRYNYQKTIQGNRHRKCFKTLEEAIAYKEEFEATLR